MPPKFTTTEVPVPLTCSSRRNLACRFEEPCYPDSKETVHSESCPYRTHCDDVSGMQPLYPAYGDRIAVTLTESSSNIVTRSENQFHGEQEHRMSLRKHVYELSAYSEPNSYSYLSPTRAHLSQWWVASLPLIKDRVSYPLFEKVFQEAIATSKLRLGKDLDRGKVFLELTSIVRGATRDKDLIRSLIKVYKDQRIGVVQCSGLENLTLSKYLGFIDLRTNSRLAPIALGLLTPPRRLRHDRNTTIIQGLYGKLFGGHTFPCTPYSMHDPDTGGAYCAQACLIMVLTILADRGSTILGSYELTIEALRSNKQPSPKREVFPVRGLSIPEMVSVLNSEACLVSATAQEYQLTGTFRKILNRLLDAYVSARCPVILGTHTLGFKANGHGSPHTLLVVGVRRSMSDRRVVTDVIIHDPSHGPYIEHSFEAYLRTAGVQLGNIPVIFCADKSVEIHACDCVEFIHKECQRDLWPYLMHFSEEERQFFAAHQIPIADISAGLDFDVRLCAKDDLEDFYSQSIGNRMENVKVRVSNLEPTMIDRTLPQNDLSREVEKLPNGWFWCFCFYSKNRLDRMMIFSTKSTGQTASSLPGNSVRKSSVIQEWKPID
jgi:hypothetical protein